MKHKGLTNAAICPLRSGKGIRKLSEAFNPQWQNFFSDSGLRAFDDFWALEMDPVDQPNQRGKGHSVVGSKELTSKHTAKRFYIKRQYRYRARTLAHPIFGIPLTEKEFNNIQRLQKQGISAIDWAYRGYDAQTSRSILVTPDLTGYQSFDQFYPAPDDDRDSEERARRALQSSARLIALLHDHTLQHSALYPHHVYINLNAKPAACFIDLEGVFKNPLGRMRVRVKDLSTFFRRGALDEHAQTLFMDAYIEASHYTFNSERLNKRMQRRTLGKLKRAQQKRLHRARTR